MAQRVGRPADGRAAEVTGGTFAPAASLNSKTRHHRSDGDSRMTQSEFPKEPRKDKERDTQKAMVKDAAKTKEQGKQ